MVICYKTYKFDNHLSDVSTFHAVGRHVGYVRLKSSEVPDQWQKALGQSMYSVHQMPH